MSEFFAIYLSLVQHLLPCFVQIVVVIHSVLLCYWWLRYTLGLQCECVVAKDDLHPHLNFKNKQTKKIQLSFMF